MLEGDTIAYTLKRETGEDAGTYAISAEYEKNQGNYEVSFTGSELTVRKGVLSVNAVSGQKAYDGIPLSAGVQGGVPENTVLSYSLDEGNSWTDTAPELTDAGTLVYSVRAENPNYEPAYASGILTVRERRIVLTSASDSRPYNGNPLRNSDVTVGGEGFAAGEGAEFRVTGLQTVVGSSENRFTYGFRSGTNAANYTVSVVYGTLTVTNRDALYTVTVKAADHDLVYNGEMQKAGGIENETFTVDGNNYRISGLSASIEQKNAGTYSIPVRGTAVVKDEAGNDVTSQFAVTAEKGTLTISKRSVVLVSASAAKAYDGSALTTADLDNSGISIRGDGFVQGEGVSVTLTGRQLLPGSSLNTFTYVPADQTSAANYIISSEYGTLTITDRNADEHLKIAVTAASRETVYSGETQNVEGILLDTFRVNGRQYTVSGLSAAAEGLHAGTYPVEITGDAVVLDEEGNDVTAQFDVERISGTLQIKPRRITLSSASVEKEYDGSPLTAPSVTVSGDGFAGDDYAEYDVTGSQLTAGTSANTFTYRLAGGAEAGDYLITAVPGILRVTDRKVKYDMTVTAAGGNFLYDGQEHTVTGLTRSRFSVGSLSYTLSGLSASASAVNAGTYPVAITGVPVITDSHGNDVTSQFAVHLRDGELNIAKRSVTLSSASAEKEYDGIPLRASTVTVSGDGFAVGEGAVFDVTGSQTVVGVSENTFAYTMNAGTNADNYSISTLFGSLNVLNRDVPYGVTVSARSLHTKYDGTTHTVSGLISDKVEIDGRTYTVAGLSAKATAVHAGEYPVTVSGTPRVFDSTGAEVTEQFAVSVQNGTLTIDRRKVHLESLSAYKTFDGDPLTTRLQENQGVIISGDGFAENEGAVITVTGTRTQPGTADNRFDYFLKSGTSADDYEISRKFGVLEVKDRSGEEKYTADVFAVDASYVYDGSEHSATELRGTEVVADGHRYQIGGLNVSVNEKNAGIYPAAVTGTPKVTDTAGNDVTDQFTISTHDGTLTIVRRDVVLRSAGAIREYDGSPLTCSTVEVLGSGFAEGEGAAYSVSGSQTIPGSSANTFDYRLTDGTLAANYNIRKEEGRLVVRSREAKYEVTVQAAGLKTLYDGKEHSVSGFVKDTFTADGHEYKVTGITAEASATMAGSYPVTITGTPAVLDENGNDVTSQFIVTLQNGMLEINRRSLVFTSADAEAEYSGNELKADNVTVTGDGFAEGEGADFTVTGTQTLPGVSKNTFTWTMRTGTAASNYDVREEYGSLTVVNRSARYAITVEASSAEALYDGHEHAVTTLRSNRFGIASHVYTVTGLTVNTAAVHAGSYPVTAEGTPVVLDEMNNDVSDQFIVTVKPGTLTVKPRRITLRSADAEKIYSGTPLSNPAVLYGGDGFAEGDGISVHVSGSRTIVGVSENTFTYTFNEGTRPGDYVVTTACGILTVTGRPDAAKYEITVAGPSGTVLYDGSEHTLSGIYSAENGAADGEALAVTVGNAVFEVSGLSAGITAVNAGSYPVHVTGTPVVRDAEGNDVTSQFIVRTVPGILKIDKRNVVLTSGSAEMPYNGRSLTNETVEVSGDGFAQNEGAVWRFSSGRTIVGESENLFTYTLNDGTSEENYNIRKEYGRLAVLNRDARIMVTISARSGEYLYSGDEYTVSGLKNTVFEYEGKNYTVLGLSGEGSGTDAGEYAVTVTGTPSVIDDAGNDVTSQFAVKTENGTLRILPRRVTLTSAVISRGYDGSPLQGGGVTVTGDGFASGEGAQFIPSAARTLPGTSENSFTTVLAANTKESNYIFTTVFGTINVTNRDAKYEITMQANSDKVLYDGEEHTVSGFAADSFTVNGVTYTVSGLESAVTAREAGIWPAKLKGQAVVKDPSGNDVTEQFAVTVENGVLEITGTYLLTVRYLDEAGRSLADPFRARYQKGQAFGPIVSPHIEGMEAQYDAVVSDVNGMPERDLELTVVYTPVRPAAAEPVVVPAAPEEPGDGGGETPQTPAPVQPTAGTGTPAAVTAEPTVTAETEQIRTGDPDRDKEVLAQVQISEDGEAELVELDEASVPLVNAPVGYWALINLIAAAASVFAAVFMAAVYLINRKKDPEDEEEKDAPEAKAEEAKEADEKESKKNSLPHTLISILIAVISVVVFILTEDMSRTMRLFDRWTILMAVLLIIQIVLVLIIAGRNEEKQEESETAE